MLLAMLVWDRRGRVTCGDLWKIELELKSGEVFQRGGDVSDGLAGVKVTSN